MANLFPQKPWMALNGPLVSAGPSKQASWHKAIIAVSHTYILWAYTFFSFYMCTFHSMPLI